VIDEAEENSTRQPSRDQQQPPPQPEAQREADRYNAQQIRRTHEHCDRQRNARHEGKRQTHAAFPCVQDRCAQPDRGRNVAHELQGHHQVQ
jgi:hypothetical protein